RSPPPRPLPPRHPRSHVLGGSHLRPRDLRLTTTRRRTTMTTDAPTNADALTTIELFPQDEDWSIQTMRLLAQVAVGGADLFECARTAARIGTETTDGEVWYREWQRTAHEVAAQGEAALAEGN